MTTEEKLAMIKTIMGPDAPDDETITSYLTLTKTEILQWRFSYNPDDMPDDVPPAYEITQVQAVINGYTQSGVEGQVLSIENGIHRHFQYADMVEYVRAHVIPIAGVLRSKSSTCPCGCGCTDTTAEDGTSDDGTQADGGDGG